MATTNGRRRRGRGSGDRVHVAALDPARLEARRASVPVITYPEELPITARRGDLLAAIRDHQVVIVAGETGSGKSTQLPKLCLELGRGIEGLIGHTQPRRVAARTIAERVAEELGTELGSTVGYTVRFTDRVGDGTLVKVMTDGILLAEIQRDRMLSRYDTLIIDEAHERSLNIDFLLGYLAQLLPRRPDLKVIVTSATIDTQRFSEHFANAPIVTVSGRTYPVEMRYRPFGTGVDGDERDERDQVQAICDAVGELSAAGPGDVLVFVSGEREIHDTADALRRLELRSTEVLPLYARLSAAEQHRVFQPHTGRRIVLSTNVAETSLTVPGVRYVVDAGTARISRYSLRLKVQRLPIEPISQASANQRAGRCGRVAPGICIRLYDEDDFLARPEFTEPEILRTNLASVILQMTSLGLGDVAAFPFLDPPDSRAVRDGVALLEELGALPPDQPADRRRLTPVGKRLAQLPVDPRLGRMVLESERHGCVREVLVIVAALSIQDPRERPTDAQQAADEAHRRFRVEGSDFLALVKLWDHLREEQQQRTSSQFRKMCRAEFLNYLRVREWQDLFSQLRQAAATVGIHSGSEAGHPDRVHQALLAGLLSHLGMRDGTTRDFNGARGSKFVLATQSVLAKKPPKWVMAAELVETNRLWGRVAATVQPEWAEHLAAHLVKRSYGEPRWDAQRGSAVVTERVSLYGLPVVAGRQVGYDRIDAADARAMFIRHALVERDWTTRHSFVAENQAVIEEFQALAEAARRGDMLDDDVLVDFYARRVGPDVVSGRHFDQWWKRERAAQPRLVNMTIADLAGAHDGAMNVHAYPDSWEQDDLTLPVTYRFEPGVLGDGVTVHVPLPVLNRVHNDGFDWQVPGFREELVMALVRTLPKEHRRNLVPMADVSRQAYRSIDPADGPLDVVLARALGEIGGARIPPDAFDVTKVPGHLRITFSVEDDDGRQVAVGTDLDALRGLLSAKLRSAIAGVTPDIERAGIERWDFGELPHSIETIRAGNVVLGFPALLDDGDSVSIRVFTNADIQSRAMTTGLRRLLLLTVTVPRKPLERELSNATRLAVAANGMDPASLADDCVVAAADQILGETRAVFDAAVWDETAFDAIQGAGRARMAVAAVAAMRTAGEILAAAVGVRQRLDRLVTPAVAAAVADAREQLARLVHPGFVTASGTRRLADVLRYVRAIDRRLEKLPSDPARDAQRMREVHALEQRYRRTLDRLPRSQVTADVVDVGWMLEELRVGVFAQALGTSGPASVQRVGRELARLG